MRFDPEYFNRIALLAQKRLFGSPKLSDFVRDGYRVVYETTEAIDRKEGIKVQLPFFLQSSDISTPFIDAEGMVCVSEDDWTRYPKGRIKAGELLIEVKGKAEKIAIVPDDFPKKTLVTGTCFKLTTKEPDDRYMLTAYLTCKYGQALKDRLKTNLLVSYLAKEDLYSLPIPNISSGLRGAIKTIFERCFAAYFQGKTLQDKAEQTLLRALGLENWQPPEPLTYTRSSRDVFAAGRLDAEHFREKYYAARQALRRAGALEFVSIEDLLLLLTNGHTPLHHDLTVGEVPFLCAEHVSDFEVDYQSEKRILDIHHQTELARTALRSGDVLLTIKGRVGNAAIAEDIPGNVNINQDVALLRFNEKLPLWYVVAFLNSTFGKLQSEQMCTGAINPFLGLFSIRQFVIPIFESSVMSEIAEQTRSSILSARKAKRRAAQLLNAAQRAVEIAIETDEATALAFLNTIDERNSPSP